MMKKLPVGVDGFEKIRTQGFYYVDKTMFIAELLENWGEVNLFTRPRRFGKTLIMDMLKAFFEIGSGKELFEGLKITQKKALCEKYMGQFPVIFITLKSVDGLNYQEAVAALRRVIGNEALRFSFLLESPALGTSEKYHGMVLGLLQSRGDWLIRSNAELGEGYSDILICTPDKTGIIIELKYADDGNLDKGCAAALEQMEARKYAFSLEHRKMKKIIKYGMAFCEKECKVVMAE